MFLSLTQASAGNGVPCMSPGHKRQLPNRRCIPPTRNALTALFVWIDHRLIIWAASVVSNAVHFLSLQINGNDSFSCCTGKQIDTSA